MVLYFTHSFKNDKGESRKLLTKAISLYLKDNEKARDLVRSIEIKDERGKPYIPDFDEFSISHSEDTWAVLIGQKVCGLDVQYIAEVPQDKVAERFFSKEEVELVRKGGRQEFFRIWTRRESLVKALGGSVVSSNLPSSLEDKVNVEGSVYSIFDIVIPTDEQDKIYSAVCLMGEAEPVEVIEI